VQTQEDLLFFLGILAPAWRASLSAIATACLRLVTFLPLPDLSLPSLCSFITLWILPVPLAPFLVEDFLVGAVLLRMEGYPCEQI